MREALAAQTTHGPLCGCRSGRALWMSGGSDLAARPRGPVSWLFVGMVRFYQRFISPLLPPACRFTPSCSEYMRQALIKHGALRGTWLGTRRLLRCHPFTPGGHDPVP